MQILTTFNLAPLTHVLGLQYQLWQSGPELATDVLRWVLGQQLRLPADYRLRLQKVKNCAYAWRQAIYLLSFCDVQQQRNIVGTVVEEYRDRALANPGLQRFEPAISGLRYVIEGYPFDASGEMAANGQLPVAARRFLGWGVGGHWLLKS